MARFHIRGKVTKCCYFQGVGRKTTLMLTYNFPTFQGAQRKKCSTIEMFHNRNKNKRFRIGDWKKLSDTAAASVTSSTKDNACSCKPHLVFEILPNHIDTSLPVQSGWDFFESSRTMKTVTRYKQREGMKSRQTDGRVQTYICSRTHILGLGLELRAKDFFLTDGADMSADMTATPPYNIQP